VGKPDVRNFRGGAGNRAMADLYRHEALNGGYRLREPKATAPVLYSTDRLAPLHDNGSPCDAFPLDPTAEAEG
jgi:hypothetical protein